MGRESARFPNKTALASPGANGRPAENCSARGFAQRRQLLGPCLFVPPSVIRGYVHVSAARTASGRNPESEPKARVSSRESVPETFVYQVFLSKIRARTGERYPAARKKRWDPSPCRREIPGLPRLSNRRGCRLFLRARMFSTLREKNNPSHTTLLLEPSTPNHPPT